MTPTSAGSPLDVVLLFDTEDIFSPPELGNDDSIKELAEIMTEEGLTGTFLFIADRAQQLRERGRADVIAAVARHEVGLHTRSARHPCAPEYTAGRSWDEGVAETLRREREGVAIIEEVFRRPCCALSAHNVFTSPMAHRAAGLLGKPYVYAYALVPPLYSLCWYAGALCLPCWLEKDEAYRTRSHFIGFDEVCADTPAFEAHLREFDGWIDRAQAEGQYFMSLMLYHPQRLRLAEFIDQYWSPNGVNFPPEIWGRQGRPRRYDDGQVATARANFRRLARKIRADRRLRPVTMAELAACHGRQPAMLTREQLRVAAEEIVAARAPRLHAVFSPAEILLGLAEALLEFGRGGALPPEVPRRAVLGPRSNPIIEPELRRAPWSEVLRFAAELHAEADRTGHLPANFGAEFLRIGVNHLHVALAEGFLDAVAGRSREEAEFRRTPRCPPMAEEIGRRFLSVAEGELVHPDMDVDALYRHGRLQAWSLKPAQPPAQP